MGNESCNPEPRNPFRPPYQRGCPKNPRYDSFWSPSNPLLVPGGPVADPVQNQPSVFLKGPLIRCVRAFRSARQSTLPTPNSQPEPRVEPSPKTTTLNLERGTILSVFKINSWVGFPSTLKNQGFKSKSCHPNQLRDACSGWANSKTCKGNCQGTHKSSATFPILSRHPSF